MLLYIVLVYNPVYMHSAFKNNHNYIYIYIYIYEMSLSYTWCNSCQVIHFLHRRFLKDLTVKNDIIKCYCFPLLSLSLFIVFHLIKGQLTFSTTHFSNESLNSLHPTCILLLLLFSLSL